MAEVRRQQAGIARRGQHQQQHGVNDKLSFHGRRGYAWMANRQAPLQMMFEILPGSVADRALHARIEVLCETADLVAVNKPAGLVCHPTKTDEWSSLISRMRLYASGQWEPRLIHRLDRETSGVVVIAKTAAAAAFLGRRLEEGGMEKSYMAWVHGHVSDDSGEICAALGRDDASHVAIKDCVRPDGQSAKTRFQVFSRIEREGRLFTQLVLEPETGRKHQLRIHMAHIGYPIVGDKIYGDDAGIYLRFVKGQMSEADGRLMLCSNQMLHAKRLAFDWAGAVYRFSAEQPSEWKELGFVP
jgi:23S rRNA pseudouridine1911/1915/1917 synthase